MVLFAAPISYAIRVKSCMGLTLIVGEWPGLGRFAVFLYFFQCQKIG